MSMENLDNIIKNISSLEVKKETRMFEQNFLFNISSDNTNKKASSHKM